MTRALTNRTARALANWTASTLTTRTARALANWTASSLTNWTASALLCLLGAAGLSLAVAGPAAPDAAGAGGSPGAGAGGAASATGQPGGSPGAYSPEALLRRGRGLLDPSRPEFDPEAACAAFLDAARLGPAAATLPEALEAAARCHLRLGRVRLSALDDLRLLASAGGAPPQPGAALRLARSAAFLGEPAFARLLLQALIAGGGAGAAQAGGLDRLIARAAAVSPEAPGRLTFDTVLEVGAEGKGIASIASGPAGEVLFLAAGEGTVLAGDGRVVAGTGEGRERPRGFAVDPDGGVWLWDEKGITAPGGERFEPREPAAPDGEGAPLRKIRGLSPGPLGEFDVLDGAGSRLLRYGPGFELLGEVAAFDARPEAIARSIDGTLHVLLPSRRQVVVIAPPRSWSRAVTPGSFRTTTIELGVTGPGLTEPIAIALDGLGRLHVLDGASRSVVVLDQAGLVVERAAPARGSEGELRSPEALAVDGEGRVYVADRRQGRVLRFR